MRLLIGCVLSLFLTCTDKGTTYPIGFVLDRETVLTQEQHSRLDSLFRAHEMLTGNEIALVTSSTFNGRTAKDFAVAFGDSVGVGKKRKDNGVVIAFSKDRREVFIATGRGMERVLHDTICARIIEQKMLPHFKADDPFGGLWNGSLSLVEFLESRKNGIH